MGARARARVRARVQVGVRVRVGVRRAGELGAIRTPLAVDPSAVTFGYAAHRAWVGLGIGIGLG